MLAKAAQKQVAATTALKGMPASLRIDGFTNTMYAIVTNVVAPAMISALPAGAQPLKFENSVPAGSASLELE